MMTRTMAFAHYQLYQGQRRAMRPIRLSSSSPFMEPLHLRTSRLVTTSCQIVSPSRNHTITIVFPTQRSALLRTTV